jgi:hypothetical protein
MVRCTSLLGPASLFSVSQCEAFSSPTSYEFSLQAARWLEKTEEGGVEASQCWKTATERHERFFGPEFNESSKNAFHFHPSLGSPGWTCVCFTFSISRMTTIKTSTSYFACASPATTAENLSSDWFMPST